VAAAGGTPSDLTQETPGSRDDDPDWSPDGSAIVYYHNEPRVREAPEIRAIGANGTSPHTVYIAPNLLTVLREPDWQPCVAGVSVSCTSVGDPVRGSAPTCLASATLSTAKNQPLELPPAPCSDPRGLPLTITATQAPGHGVLSEPNVQGRRRYTPNRDFVGQDVIRYQASNGTALSNVATLIVNVLGSGGPGATGDRTAPTVRWLGRARLDRRGRARTHFRCDEPCLVSLRLVGKRRPKGKFTGPKKTVIAAANRPTTLALALRRRSGRMARGRLRRVTVVGFVRDGAGNRRSLRRRVSLGALRARR
jgi:hypothetical protein